MQEDLLKNLNLLPNNILPAKTPQLPSRIVPYISRRAYKTPTIHPQDLSFPPHQILARQRISDCRVRRAFLHDISHSKPYLIQYLLSCLCLRFVFEYFLMLHNYSHTFRCSTFLPEDSPHMSNFLYILPLVLPILSINPCSVMSLSNTLVRDSFTPVTLPNSDDLYHLPGCMAFKIV